MMNALQGADALAAGFHNAMTVMNDRRQERAESSAYAQLLGEYNELVAKHNNLVSIVNAQAAALTQARRDAEVWREIATG